MEQLLLSRSAKHSGPSTRTATEGKAQGRLLYIDNLRWVMIMLAVFLAVVGATILRRKPIAASPSAAGTEGSQVRDT